MHDIAAAWLTGGVKGLCRAREGPGVKVRVLVRGLAGAPGAGIADIAMVGDDIETDVLAA